MNTHKCILMFLLLLNVVHAAAEIPEFRVTPQSSNVKGLEVSVVTRAQLGLSDGRNVLEVVVKMRAPINSRTSFPEKLRLELWGRREYIASIDITRTEVSQLPRNITVDILKDDAVFYFKANKEVIDKSWITFEQRGIAVVIEMNQWVK